ncbi:MAG: hypothetical protein ACI4J5_02870 [Oscillospiraceae bacterium]
MDVRRKRLEKTLAKNIENTSVIAELLFEPSFRQMGKNVYCQIRQRECDNEIFICIEYFRGYNFQILDYNEISEDRNDSIYTDNFCGIVMLDKESQDKLTKCISEVNSLKRNRRSQALGLDGYFHTVCVNDHEFRWWCKPKTEETKLANELVNKVFSHLPPDFRKIND